MRRALVIFFVGVFCISSNAQSVAFKWGQPNDDKTNFRQVVVMDNGEIIKLSVEEGSYAIYGIGGAPKSVPTLSKYDSNLNFIKSYTFNVTEKGIRVRNIKKINNIVYIFTCKYDKNTKSSNYFAQAINATTLTPQDSLINLGSFLGDNLGVPFKGIPEHNVEFAQSKDSTKLLLFAINPYSKKENKKYSIAVYDLNMNKIWDKSIELPYLDKAVEICKYVVTNNGDVCVLFKYYENSLDDEYVKVNGVKVPAYKTKMVVYGANDKIQELDFDYNGKYISNITIFQDAASNLTLFGTNKIAYDGGFTNYFVKTYKKNDYEILLNKTEEFPKKLTDILFADDQGNYKINDPGISSQFKIKEVLQKENGNNVYVMEYYGVYESTFSSGRSANTYSYGDIILIEIDNAGKANYTRIPKLQESTDWDGANSFIALTKNNKVYLLYNDEPKNLQQELTKKPVAVRVAFGCSFGLAEVNEKGEVSRKVLITNSEMKETVKTQSSFKVAPNKAWLYTKNIVSDVLQVGTFSPKTTKYKLGIIEVR